MYLIPECICISICPSELESAIKDPYLEDSLYSATCRKMVEGPSNMTARAEAEAIRA